MPTKVEVVPSPRPDVEPPLPTYHELLDYLCEEFNIPGSPTFWDAVKYIKEGRANNRTQKFTNWYKSIFKSERLSERVSTIFQNEATTPEGRQRIVAAYVNPARVRFESLRSDTNTFRRLEARRDILIIENLIAILPEEERFSESVMALRSTLVELHAFLARVTELHNETPPYTGPRPTRFERLLFNNEEPSE